MKKARIIFSLILVISAVVVIILEPSTTKKLKPYMLIGLVAINIINGGVFYRENKKTNNLIMDLINFIAIIVLIFWVL